MLPRVLEATASPRLFAGFERTVGELQAGRLLDALDGPGA